MLLSAVVISGTAMAQRPVDANPFSLEGGISLNTGASTFSAPTIRLRYFAADNIAGRLSIGHMSTTDNMNIYGFDGTGGQTADSTGTIVDKNSATTIGIGASYHFSQMDRLSPYAALDLSFGMGSSSTDMTDTDGTDYVNGLSANANSKSSGIGFGIGAGCDYYFAENIFIGAELGFYYMSWTDKGGESSATFGGTTVSSETLSSGSNSSLGNGAQGTIRLGWRF